MVRIDGDTLTRIARLARLDLGEEETADLVLALEALLSYADRLPEGIGDASPGSEPHVPEREDLPRPGVGSEAALREAPDTLDSLFRVPPVIEDRSGA
jgi:aspartyl/glutamyl-tRNA(Asn/Gln) amidotransferase C subunit